MYEKLLDLLFPLLSRLALFRHRGIWGLKEAVVAAPSAGRRERLRMIYDRLLARQGSWIGYNAVFRGIPCFPHAVSGIFISGDARLGRNVVIFQQVSIGSNTLADGKRRGAPTIGDNVYIGTGARIVGRVTIGDNCRIGANAVVYEDMPPNSVAVQQPTRVIQRDGELDNRFFTRRGGRRVWYDDGCWVEAGEEEGREPESA
jgi:serine O-acetyltransferase